MASTFLAVLKKKEKMPEKKGLDSIKKKDSKSYRFFDFHGKI